MTRVPPPKAPPTNRPSSAQRASSTQRASQTSKTARPQTVQRQKISKPVGAQHAHTEGAEESTALPEGHLEPEVSHEERAEEAAERAHEAWAPDAHDDVEEKLEAEEALREAERVEGKEDPIFSQKYQPQKKDPAPKTEAKKPSDGFEQKQMPKAKSPLPGALGGQHAPEAQKAQHAKAAQAVAAAQAASAQAKADKPPDAMTVLNNAKEAGVFFVEDQNRDGHSEEAEDPELRAAVEETIRLLFGVAGIHRVGPGKNESGDSVVVIVAGKGFGQASMRAVPEKVHRFATLLALPYELLPLRRER